jgi:hypothetical protein
VPGIENAGAEATGAGKSPPDENRRREEGRASAWQWPTLPGRLRPSTIGAGGLNCRVREGTGCTPTAQITKHPSARFTPAGDGLITSAGYQKPPEQHGCVPCQSDEFSATHTWQALDH